ncbi:phage tail protein [Vibrio sp. Isolate31]|uniref:phage tail-collar fiber domain-containing protein n=1 Tax=unclassified Vibrio TaxID=2614977 RepID=UPI001EFC94C5|nr:MULTISPECIES: phage tail protein [unclassified Vibrio]MCG9554590.1 phage tail protein [Vibrio sp. Isolate32]MCG9600889.1 phage tail protein [Vibrio sp. Isolate31]
MAVITIAGEQLIARKQQAKQPLVIREFVLAHVPNLDPLIPPRRDQSLPTSRQIVFRSAPTRSACVNGNEVVYSLILDNTVGNFQFNWLGLISEEGVLISANQMVVQSKRKNNERTSEEGNNLTRNFLLKFSGAQAITNITVTPETWQFNYEAKLDDMDTLLAQLTVGLIETQKDVVEQSYENLMLSEANRELGMRLDEMNTVAMIRERRYGELRLEMNRSHKLSEHRRFDMDVSLTTALLKSQQNTVEQMQMLMKLNEKIRVMEK